LEERFKYLSLFEYAPVPIAERDFSAACLIIQDMQEKNIKTATEYAEKHSDKIIECLNSSHIIAWNQAMRDFWEVRNVHEANEIILNAIENDMNNPISASLLSSLYGLIDGHKHFSREEAMTTPGGKMKNIIVNVLVAPGCEDSLERVYISFYEITSLKITENKLKEYQNHLEQMVEKRTAQLNKLRKKELILLKKERNTSQQLKEELEKRLLLTRLIVHELKTPLTSLSLSSETLSRTANKSQMKLIKNITTSSYILGFRTNALIDMAKGEIGVLKLNIFPIDLSEMLEEVAQTVYQHVKKMDQKLVVNNSTPDLKFQADAERLQQVLFNLIDNAVKFNREHGSIILTTFTQDSSLVFKVQDEGRGFSQQERENAFQLYGKIRSDSDHLTGLGIGLYLSNMIIELHGGQMFINSDEGKGSIVGFYIPLAAYKTDNKKQAK
jgi:signal transduction histidine kinase